MTALYTLTDQYLQLAQKLADGDFDAQTIADTIEASGIADEIAVKAQGIECMARASIAHNEAIDAEIDRLKALKLQRQKVADGLREYLKSEMERAGIEKIECPIFKMSIAKNPPAVDVFEQGLVPADYMRQPDPPPPAIDKAAIKESLKLGRDVPGARLVQGTRLVVK